MKVEYSGKDYLLVRGLDDAELLMRYARATTVASEIVALDALAHEAINGTARFYAVELERRDAVVAWDFAARTPKQAEAALIWGRIALRARASAMPDVREVLESLATRFESQAMGYLRACAVDRRDESGVDIALDMDVRRLLRRIRNGSSDPMRQRYVRMIARIDDRHRVS